MPFISIRCYAELNDFLPPHQGFVTFPLSVPDNTLLKDLASKIGIPSGLIDLILVNNKPVCFSYRLEENDRVAFYPVFENFDISSVTKVRGHPLRQPKFILDVHLGKLAHHLRMFGFDTLYQNNWTKESCITISINENRILLSRCKSLLNTESLTHAYLIKDTDPNFQLNEVLDRFDLYSLASPFTRCIECNTKLQHVEKEIILTQIPQKVKEWCNEYQRCSTCNRIYWKGSHYEHMIAFVQDTLSGHSHADEAKMIN
jgi:uncharacterized protein with PIN domain